MDGGDQPQQCRETEKDPPRCVQPQGGADQQPGQLDPGAGWNPQRRRQRRQGREHDQPVPPGLEHQRRE
ncbi:MAG: hypothetical protein MZV65_49570 [Chromatiales bacterium]|nr:hypothetical protein [Chromatiales bacterium]